MLKFLVLIILCSSFSVMGKTYLSEGQKFEFQELTRRGDSIWGIDFLPGKRILFTERAGKMLILDETSKKVSEVSGLPKVYSVGQGGLLDVRVHPNFEKNNLIFFTYSDPIEDKATTSLASAELKNGKLENLKKLFSAYKPNDNDIHFGSRIEFDGKGHIFITVGDRDERQRAQDLGYHQGKVLRLNEDGSVPKDNPYSNVAGARPEIYSYGHRSPQGLVRHPETGVLFEAEMGPRGGDEINIIEASKNYGWPVITFGKEYWGPSIGEGTAKPGMEQPIAHWVPSISPSGISFYSGNIFPKWKGNLFLANLSGQHLRRLVLDGNKVLKQEELLKDLDYRFRMVRERNDGHLYITTDDGRIGRLVPSK